MGWNEKEYDDRIIHHSIFSSDFRDMRWNQLLFYSMIKNIQTKNGTMILFQLHFHFLIK